jgi:hypothetical protein
MKDEQKITLNTLEELQKVVSTRVKGQSLEIERMSSELQLDKEKLQNLEGTIQFLREIAETSTRKAALVNVALNDIEIGNLVIDQSPIPPERLRGLSQPRAMILVAKHFGGFLRPKQLADALITARRMKKTKNSNSIASRLIRDSERFERIADGFYKLKTPDSQGGSEEAVSRDAPRVQ